MPTKQYCIILDKDLYGQFCDLAVNHENKFLKFQSGKFRESGNRYISEVNRTEFCMILLQIKDLNRKSPLIQKMIQLGVNQDLEFSDKLHQIEREAQRYGLLNHH